MAAIAREKFYLMHATCVWCTCIGSSVELVIRMSRWLSLPEKQTYISMMGKDCLVSSFEGQQNTKLLLFRSAVEMIKMSADANFKM